MARREGGGGRLFEGGNYFKYFGQSGAINLIEGRLLFEEIRYSGIKLGVCVVKAESQPIYQSANL